MYTDQTVKKLPCMVARRQRE